MSVIVKKYRRNRVSDVTIIFQARSNMKAPFARFVFAVAFILVAGYSFVTLRGPRGIPALLEKQRQIEVLEKRNAALAREIERKREHVKRLTDNPGEQELEVREKLKMLHPGEKVYITGDPAKK